jgi:hypothetical protein
MDSAGYFIRVLRERNAIKIFRLPHTVCKMGLMLRSKERMLKMQFSIGRKFTLQPLHRYDVKPPEKTAEA